MVPAWSGRGGALVPTAELCRSCVPPAHQLLYLNCNCCSQLIFTYHHAITQITVSHFVFFCFIKKKHPPLPMARGGAHTPSKSIPEFKYDYHALSFSVWLSYVKTHIDMTIILFLPYWQGFQNWAWELTYLSLFARNCIRF
jgi:hypothetical protein